MSGRCSPPEPGVRGTSGFFAAARRPKTGSATVCAALLGILTALLGGCGQAPPEAEKTATGRIDPKKQFDQIVNRFKQCYQNLHIVLPARPSDSSTRRLNVHVVQEVAHHVTGGEGGPYTAQMTVRTRTDYSLYEMNPGVRTGQNSPGSAEDNSAEAAGGASQNAESGSSSAPERRQTVLERSASQFLNDREEQQVQTIDFVFANGRWDLTSKDLDPSIKLAVQFALRSQ